MTKRAYKERFYPTSEQAELLAQSFGCARFVWNNTLAYRTEAYQQRGESVSHSSAEKRLVGLKAEFPWLRDVSSVILQQTLRDQKAAFDNFFNPSTIFGKSFPSFGFTETFTTGETLYFMSAMLCESSASNEVPACASSRPNL